MELLISLLWFLVYIVILVGVVWVINWAVDNIGEALPAKLKIIVKAIIAIVGIIVLLTYLSSGAMTIPKIR